MQVLVVYYSRTGVTKRACNAIADALRTAEPTTEVTVEEIVDKADRAGALGYARAGKDAMMKKLAEIEPMEADPGEFDLVVIGTPVWAWTCAPAPRTFCEQFAQQLNTVAFVATMGGSGDKGAFEALGEVCGKAPVATLALRDRFVKADSPEEFIGPVGSFAQVLLEEAGG